MKAITTALKVLFMMTILTGIVYPVLVTSIARTFFQEKADGSLITFQGKIIGSQLIGQRFDSIIWFTSRPSAINYAPLPSGGSNFGPTNKIFLNLVKERNVTFVHKNLLNDSTKVPSEMLYASASGLDPHISPRAALLQVDRIAKARGFNKKQTEKLYALIDRMTEMPQFHLFGEKRINVFMLNLELDKI